MARFARLVVPDVPHHVTHRGNRRGADDPAASMLEARLRRKTSTGRPCGGKGWAQSSIFSERRSDEMENKYIQSPFYLSIFKIMPVPVVCELPSGFFYNPRFRGVQRFGEPFVDPSLAMDGDFNSLVAENPYNIYSDLSSALVAYSIILKVKGPSWEIIECVSGHGDAEADAEFLGFDVALCTANSLVSEVFATKKDPISIDARSNAPDLFLRSIWVAYFFAKLNDHLLFDHVGIAQLFLNSAVELARIYPARWDNYVEMPRYEIVGVHKINIEKKTGTEKQRETGTGTI